MNGAKRIGLFFGSFNPVHIGHMIIAEHMATMTELDQIWMVISPHNPHKKKSTLARDHDRLHLVHLAIGDNTHLRASDIEFNLPQPSYTVDTLAYLKEKFPEYAFSLIMGGDNLATLHKWKNYEQLLENPIYVYQRPGYELGGLKDHPNVCIEPAPLLQISASLIRARIKEGKSVRYLLPESVYDYLDKSSIYR